MADEEKILHPFISYLAQLRDREERGPLAALRRGYARPPGTVGDMYRYVAPWVRPDAPRREEDTYYLIAALFAFHPAAGGQGNLGRAFAQAREPQGDDTALERRFTALLSASAADLPNQLRQAVSFLRAKEIPIDWSQLFEDVNRWSWNDRPVQREWARSFWGRTAPTDNLAPQPEKAGAPA